MRCKEIRVLTQILKILKFGICLETLKFDSGVVWARASPILCRKLAARRYYPICLGSQWAALWQRLRKMIKTEVVKQTHTTNKSCKTNNYMAAPQGCETERDISEKCPKVHAWLAAMNEAGPMLAFEGMFRSP